MLLSEIPLVHFQKFQSQELLIKIIVSCKYELPLKEAEKFLQCWFVDTYGLSGYNIPGKFCLEYLNHLTNEIRTGI